jgi:hypothetical protein
VKEDGMFTLSTYGEGDGAPAGADKVAILPSANFEEGISLQVKKDDGPDPAFDASQNPETSGIEVTIEERRNELPPFELE